MGGTANLDNMDFIDLTRYGSFYHQDGLKGVHQDGAHPYSALAKSPEGAAQIARTADEIEVQTGEEPSADTVYKAMYNAQIAQEAGRNPELTDEEVLGSHGPGWLCKNVSDMFCSASGVRVEERAELEQDGATLTSDNSGNDMPSYVGAGGAAWDEANRQRLEEAGFEFTKPGGM